MQDRASDPVETLGHHAGETETEGDERAKQESEIDPKLTDFSTEFIAGISQFKAKVANIVSDVIHTGFKPADTYFKVDILATGSRGGNFAGKTRWHRNIVGQGIHG
jgi:hypothetical protein